MNAPSSHPPRDAVLSLAPLDPLHCAPAEISETPCDPDSERAYVSLRIQDALSTSAVKRVHVVGRRGIAQASWTTKEVREVLYGVSGAAPRIHPDDLQLSDVDREELASDRARRRCVELFMKAQADGRMSDDAARQLIFRFRRSPTAFRTEGNVVKAVQTVQTHLTGAAGKQRATIPAEGAVMEEIACDMAVKSVGYRALAMDGVPFDQQRAVVPNENGKVTGEDRLFVAGWLKRGPSGIIGTNKWDAEETITSLLATNPANPHRDNAPNHAALHQLLDDRNIYPISTQGWNRIDAEERRKGKERGTPREKISDLSTLLQLATH